MSKEKPASCLQKDSSTHHPSINDHSSYLVMNLLGLSAQQTAQTIGEKIKYTLGVSQGENLDVAPVTGHIETKPESSEKQKSRALEIPVPKKVKTYSLFIFEVVKAHAPSSPKYPKTIHYRGEGRFMISGPSLNLSKRFKPEMLL